MTQQEKQIKLAEHCFPEFQWSILDDGTVRRNCLVWEDNRAPDYFGDLNAVAKLEAALPEWKMGEKLHGTQTHYLDELQQVCRHSDGCASNFEVVTATASQHAEALGITLGLWKEGE